MENNGTFYRLPAREVFASWRERVPGDFVMTVKASRYLTHVRRLRDPADPVRRLLAAAAGLGGRLGPVLLQLPPDLRAAPGLLRECLRQFPAGDPGRGRAQARVLVDRRGAGRARGARTRRCAGRTGKGSAVTPLWRTAGWGYLRLHEGDGEPWPSYRDATLATWADRITASWAADRDVYVYFNNDQNCAAPRDAARLAAAVAGRGGQAAPAWPGWQADG